MILIPKRKLISGTPIDESIETAVGHAAETVITQIEVGYGGYNTVGRFTHRLQIPVGTDKYD